MGINTRFSNIPASPQQLAKALASRPVPQMRPAPQSQKYGGAVFGGGGGGANRYDHTQLGGGLYSIGIDIASPSAAAQAKSWYDSQPANVRSEVQKGMGNQPGRGSIDPLLYAVDWRQRDVARKIKKVHSPLGPLGALAPIAAGFIPGVGPGLSAALSAGIGASTGGWKGALLGGLGSLVVPAINLPGGLGGALKAPAQAATSVAQQLSSPMALGRFGVSKYLGSQSQK